MFVRIRDMKEILEPQLQLFVDKYMPEWNQWTKDLPIS